MSDIATTPGAVIAEAVDSPRAATVPALVGLIGAAAGLPMSTLGLPLFFVAASLPMSALGLALGLRQRHGVAILLAIAGLVLASAGFILG